MKVHPCGHVARLGPKLMCRHLMGEDGLSHDYVHLLTGRGMEYHLCCEDCDKARADGVEPELLEACEGCVERIDDPDNRALVGWRGEPEIPRRPEPFDAVPFRTELPRRLREPVDFAAVAGEDRPVWMVLTDDGRIMRFDADTGDFAVLGRVRLPSETGRAWNGGELRRRLHVAPRGDFAAVVRDYGRHGAVVDLATGKTVMKLDGGDYRCDTVPFSLAFTEHEGRTVVVHRTDWNRVDATDPATGELLTDRTLDKESSLDYFHGALHVSADGRWIVDDGWVWAPVGIPYAWDLRAWLSGEPRVAEEGLTRLAYRDYHWDGPMAWAGDAFAIAGIGPDDIALLDGVVLVHPGNGDDSPVNVFPGPRGALFGDARRLYSAGPDGLEVWDPFTGERTAAVPGFVPARHHPGARELAAVSGPVMERLRLPA
ncbi:hypothetical protein GCM10009678_87700 [Actinomadura kijaniata]|uniref:Uncharacterized protein n=1 Tax=Actinomadura namibiensis TaxID=182080 RepID=A0A7W3QNI2_ACTNM|nr:hypothetical protein [Actinomadura namibiensis]MBA8953652.1 hypothetical protein [Actinomadura namibiensis]